MGAGAEVSKRAAAETTGERPRLLAFGRRLLWRPAVLYVLLTPLAFSILEMLLSRRAGVQYAVDVFDGDLPLLAALRADWLRYGPSLWDPHLTSGNPSLLQLALPFAPDFLLSFVVPLFVAYCLTYAAIIWSAGLGMHLFLRDSLRLRTGACVVGAVFYMFSFWHYVHGFAVPLLPLSLWLIDRWANAGRRWHYSLALVALGAFQLYAGLLQLVVVVAALQFIYLVLAYWRSGRLRRLALEWLGVWLLCGLLFAPVLVTQLVYLPTSQRTIWDVSVLNPTAPAAALSATVSLFGSALAGIPVAGLTVGSAEYSGTFFLGALGLPLLYLGLFGRRGVRARFLLALLPAVPLLYVLSLVLLPLQAQLGFLKSFQLDRVSHLFPFVLAANAAVGADLLVAGDWREALRGRARLAGLTALLALLGLEAAASAANWAALGGGGQVEAGWLLAAVAIGGGTLATGLLLLWAVRFRGARAVATPLLLLLLLGLVGERAAYARAERFLEQGLSTYQDYMAVDAGFRYVAEQPNPGQFRTLTAGFAANRALNSGLFDAGGYQSIYPLAYHDLFGVLTGPHLSRDPADWRYFNSWGNRAFAFGPELDLPVADLMGIRWIWSWGMPFQDPQLIPRLQFHAITVYENVNVFPRAFVVNRVQAFASDAALLAGLEAADDSSLRSAAFVVAGAGDGLIPSGGGQGASQAAISRYTPDRVDVWVRSAEPGLLVLSDPFATGWTATACGRAAPIVRVDAAYRGVPVPAGTCTVTFKYRPLPTYAGIVAAGLTTGGLIGFSLFAVLRDRRRAPAAVRPAAAALSADG